MRTTAPFMQFDMLKLLYFSYCYSIMLYGPIWANAADTKKVFNIQKKITTMTTVVKKRSLVGSLIYCRLQVNSYEGIYKSLWIVLITKYTLKSVRSPAVPFIAAHF